MRKANTIETGKIITMIILLLSTYIKASAQSPYAIFGDDSKMLEAKSEPVPSIYRVGIQSPNGANFYADFDLNKGLATLYDVEGNILRQDSISENAKAMFTTMDPHAENYYNLSPYCYCGGNPVNVIDPTGCDTLNISFNQGKWIFSDPIIAKGDDVFNVTIDGVTNAYTFSEGNWGERVDALNLEVTSGYTLGIYHVSGVNNSGTGYYVTPGGDPSSLVGSGRRIPEGMYPIISPNSGAQWQQPGVGGSVANRGVRFHYGAPYPRKWTEGCFVLSSDYTKLNNTVLYNMLESQNAVQNFDRALGGSSFYPYKTRTGKSRYGSSFTNGINKNLILKGR